VAFPEGLDPLPPMALISTALNPDVLLGAVTTGTLINKASSFASAPPTKYVSLVFSGGATDGAARSFGGVVIEGLREVDVGTGRAGPYDLAEPGGVPGGVSNKTPLGFQF
jgi:hypothetical protein